MCTFSSLLVITCMIVLCVDFFNYTVRFESYIWFSNKLNCDSVYNDKGSDTLHGVVEQVMKGLFVLFGDTVIK